ncbi:MAG: hypothetical protein ABI837_03155 [Acidobacteriota bacterium]
MDVEQRLQGIDQRLQFIEERLSRLEQAPAPSSTHSPLPMMAPVSAESQSERDDGPASGLLALTGKAILVLGGAFLLRAATESTAVPLPVGIAAGLLYAAVWIIAAAMAARAGRRTAAVFHCVASSAVAYPILWEATTHFHVLTATTGSILLAGFSVAFMFVGHRYDLQLPGWIAAAGATLDALFLAYVTGHPIPFLLELTVVGIVAFVLSKSPALAYGGEAVAAEAGPIDSVGQDRAGMGYVGWLLAIESDLFAVFMVLATLFAQSKEKHSVVVVALLLFAIGWMTVVSRTVVQVAIASFIGIAGASAIALSPSATTILWGCAAVVAAEIARRSGNVAFAIQSVTWGILAAIAGRLLLFAAETMMERDQPEAISMTALIAAALCFVAFLRLDFARVPLLAVVTVGAAGAIIQAVISVVGAGAGAHALVRTIVLAGSAVALATIGRIWRVNEASQLAAVLLVITGVQVIAQELRAGTAAIMFFALAVYGGAMLAIARLRKAPAIS